MGNGNIQSKQQFAKRKLAEMARLDEKKRLAALRQIMDRVLGFTLVNGIRFPTDIPLLPAVADVVGTLSNEFGPDYTAAHFNLRDHANAKPHSPQEIYEQVQAANEAVQLYAGEEIYPLLIFTVHSGVQFLTGNPAPGENRKLLNVAQTVFYWNNRNDDATANLAQVGDQIAKGEVPQRAFKTGFSEFLPWHCQHCDSPNDFQSSDFREAIKIVEKSQKGAAAAQQVVPQEANIQSRGYQRDRLYPEFDKVWREQETPTMADFAEAHAILLGRKPHRHNTDKQVSAWCAVRAGNAHDAYANEKQGRKTERFRLIQKNGKPKRSRGNND